MTSSSFEHRGDTNQTGLIRPIVAAVGLVVIASVGAVVQRRADTLPPPPAKIEASGTIDWFITRSAVDVRHFEEVAGMHFQGVAPPQHRVVDTQPHRP